MVMTASDPMVPHLFEIIGRRKETHDTFTLELEPANGSDFSGFRPGQFNMLYVYGVGEVPISISGNPDKPDTLIHTTRAVGTVTNEMSRLRKGHKIGIRGPFGTNWPVETAEGQDVVIIAGGIGLAPLRPAMYHMLANREKYGRIILLYGARTPEDMLYPSELQKWRGRFDLEVDVTVNSAMRGWSGKVGVVTKLFPKLMLDPLDTIAMICGPEIMMHYSILELQQQGIDSDKIFVSMERNMKCATGFCGHCQLGPTFVCKDGPVFCFEEIKQFFQLREV
jgi:NAD(P)H-flavin reductase